MKPLVWCDLETTGLLPAPTKLYPEPAKLLEVAFAVTDEHFQLQWEATWTLPCTDLEAAYAATNPFVQKMHTENGLWADVHELTEKLKTEYQKPISEISAEFLSYVEGEVLQELAKFGIGINSRERMHGYNPAFDLSFLHEHMFRLWSCFDHNKGDVRSLEHFCLLWGKQKHKPVNHNHRALDDLHDEIAAAVHYRGELGL